MGVKKEEILKSLFDKRADELLTGTLVIMAKKDEARVEPSGGRIKGLPENTDSTKPPKKFRVAMSREDRQEWAEAYDAEHQGFYEDQTLTISRPEPGAKIFGTHILTLLKNSTEAGNLLQDLRYNNTYRVQDCEWQFNKRKVRLCVMGNQQKEGVHYQLGELYAPS
jgi:hypothetical protein